MYWLFMFSVWHNKDCSTKGEWCFHTCHTGEQVGVCTAIHAVSFNVIYQRVNRCPTWWLLQCHTQGPDHDCMQPRFFPPSFLFWYCIQFNEQEVELLILGTLDIDIDEWWAATEYNGYSGSNPVIVWWWWALKSFNQDERAKSLSSCSMCLRTRNWLRRRLLPVLASRNSCWVARYLMNGWGLLLGQATKLNIWSYLQGPQKPGPHLRLALCKGQPGALTMPFIFLSGVLLLISHQPTENAEGGYFSLQV